MSYRNLRLSAGFLSLDRFAESVDPAKSRVFSDNGEGEMRTFRAAEWDPQAVAAEARALAEKRGRNADEIVPRLVLLAIWLGFAHNLAAAAARISDKLGVNSWQFAMLLCAEFCLFAAKKERLLPVLEQVVANGRNRRESIAHLCRVWRRKWSGTRRNYYRGVQDLLMFFSANKIKGETNF